MRPRERRETGEQDLFRSRLDRIIDLTPAQVGQNHSLQAARPTSVALRRPQDHASKNSVTNGLRISRRSTCGT